MYAVQWGQFLNIIAYQSGVFGHLGRTGRAGSGCIVPTLKEQLVGGVTGGGLRSFSPAVGGQ